MTNDTMTQHLTTEKIANYFGKLLLEEEESQVELHFAECDDCTQRARRWHAFSENWDSWTAQTHGQAFQQAQQAVQAVIAAALQEVAAAANPGLHERLADWIEKGHRKAEAVAHVVFEAPGKVARIVTEGLEGLVRPEANWQFAIATAGVRTRGAARMRVRGVVSQPTTERTESESPQPLVTVSGSEGKIEVRVDQLPSQPATQGSVRTRGAAPQLPLVLLVPTKGGGEPHLRKLEQDSKGGLSACFTDVAPGDYLVVVEPID